MSKRKLSPEEQTRALAFHLKVRAQGCQYHEDENECEGPIQAAHVISKSALRRHGHTDALWDPRNGIALCYQAHRRSDLAIERFPYEKIPEAVFEFAREIGMEWWLERTYGGRDGNGEGQNRDDVGGGDGLGDGGSAAVAAGDDETTGGAGGEDE